MKYEVNKSIEILERTPMLLKAMLGGLSLEWVMTNEGPDTWSPFDVVGHLIHGEKTDWIPRTEIILSASNKKTFAPFDRFAQYESSKGKALTDLLAEFAKLRANNLRKLKAYELNPHQLDEKGVHPVFGEVTLRELLACWTAHDLNHISQISRVMAKQYQSEVGPWRQYLRILN